MRDEGLRLAISSAGGVAALARGLGIKQPSVSAWRRIPADRVFAVETMTGISRGRLRPDIFGEALTAMRVPDRPEPGASPSSGAAVDEVELARALHYLVLARLLRAAPTAATLEELSRLNGDGSPLGLARIALAEAANRTGEKDAAAEFFTLFIGIGRGELLPYGSYYLTGFLHERPLARLRQDLAQLGIERSDGNFDPEDHIGLLFEIMGGFANGMFEADLARQREFFERHISPWAERFLADLTVSPSARFYKHVATLGRELVALEREAFALGD